LLHQVTKTVFGEVAQSAMPEPYVPSLRSAFALLGTFNFLASWSAIRAGHLVGSASMQLCTNLHKDETQRCLA
jgi:hypothetical protein